MFSSKYQDDEINTKFKMDEAGEILELYMSMTNKSCPY